MAENNKKILIFRLSSLGDLILCSSALSSPQLVDRQVTWVVSQEYASLLEGHPSGLKVVAFDRRQPQGLLRWLKLNWSLAQDSYSEVFDLHSSTRTKMARWVFLTHHFFNRGVTFPRWKTLPKGRLRLWGYFIFKRHWPKKFRPKHLLVRVSETMGVAKTLRPDFRYLLKNSDGSRSVEKYHCVMPGSAWVSKQWPTNQFFKLIQELKIKAAVVGKNSEPSTQRLKELLKKEGMLFEGISDDLSWTELARILKESQGFIGNDTGLAHFAQSIGVKTQVLFGPTTSDLGFGPWAEEAVALEKPLSCRPCSKDGRYCYRFWDPYACLKKFSADEVAELMK